MGSRHRRTIHALLAARARIAHGWTKHREERWVYGRHTVCAIKAIQEGVYEALNEEARQRGAAVGAPVIQATRIETENMLLAAIKELWVDREWSNIPTWNDEPERKKEEVLDAFDRALKIAGHDS
jgi:hypothetical protein